MTGLDHVLWLGGASGAGKTTVAGRLVRRWGLRLYSSDTRTWEHRDRAIAAGIPAAVRFEALSHEERLSVPIEERRGMDLVVERPAMVADDLRQLAPPPLVLAEGTTLPVSLAHPARSVWLMPTGEFQSRNRPSDRIRIHPIEDVAAEAKAHGIPMVVVDGLRPIGRIVDEVEALLIDSLSVGPLAAAADERQALLREANLAVVQQIRSGCARPWASNLADAQVRTFVCECGQRTCDVELQLPVATAATQRVIAPSHR